MAGTFLSEFRFSPDGSRVVYLAADDSHELFSVPSDASSAPVRLNGPLAANRDVRSFQISPDGARVVYDADQVRDATFELFAAPIDGSAPAVRLHPAFAAARRVRFFQVLPGSARVVYSADQEQRDVVELFSVPIDGLQPPVKLNRALPLGGDVYFFSSTPDGRRIVYFGEQDVNDVSEFYLAASDGSSVPRRLNDPLAPGEVVSTGHLSPTGTHLVYAVAGPTSYEIFGVPILRDVEATLLSGPMSSSSFQTSPDGARVIFHGRIEGVSGLFSVPIDRSEEPVQLNLPPLDGSADVHPSVLVSPDSKTVVFRADKDTLGVNDLFRAPLDGSQSAVQLSPTFEGEIVGDVVDVHVSPAGERALFRVWIPHESDATESELYSVALDAREPVRIFPSGTVGAGDRDDLRVVRLAPGAGRVVFQAGSEEGEDYDLFSAPLDGSAPPVRLNDRLGSGYGPALFELAGGLAVYMQDDDDRLQLFAAPVDGSSGPVQLTSAGADQFRLSPDGASVAYAATGATSLESALFRVATDGSSAPVQLVPTLHSPRGFPFELQISGDSARLIYRTDQDAGDVFELYSVPLDGSAGPTKLSGALVPGGDVFPQVLLLDGRVLYRADQELDERVELYSVPLDGSSPPVKLSGALVPGGDVRDGFQVTPDQSRVVYLADQEADERFELFVTPVDGSSPPVKLNAPLAAGGDVASTPGIPFRIGPDGARVVYRADQVCDEVFELYSVPIDRSAPPLQISGFLPPGGDVTAEFEIGTDGREVVYVADQDRDEVFELFRTPIDRIKQSQRISAPLVEGGDVARVEVAPGSRAVYFADQDVDGVIELYLTSVSRRERLFLPR